MNQLFIGVWNHKEKDGTISDEGGVFTDKNKLINEITWKKK